MAMTGFICHDDYLNKTAKLSDEEVGRLFRACMRYSATGEEQELEGRESVAFDFIREDIDRAKQAYTNKCETNRRNRYKGIEQASTVVNDRQQTSTDEHNNKNNNKNKNKNKNKNNSKNAEAFDRFWKAYPRKTAKENARKEFEKLNPDESLLTTMLNAVEKQKQSEQWQEERFIPHASTWIHQKRWEDETTVAQRKTIPAADFEQRDYTGVQESMMDDLASEFAAFKAKGVG